jgi:hypothetical protein
VTVTSSNAGCVTVNGSSSASGSAPSAFTIAPVGAGTCSLTIAAANGSLITDSVTVTIPTGLTVLQSGSTISSLAFYGTSSTYAQTVQVEYTSDTAGDPFTVSGCSSNATITGSGTAPGPATYTITPTAVGSCTLTVSAGNGASTTIPVTINSTTITGN